MISQVFRIFRMIALASFALTSAAWATCSNPSLSGTYGFLHSGISNSVPVAGLTQVTFDPTTGTYKGEDTASQDGLISAEPLTATYKVNSNCTVTARVKIGSHPGADASFALTPSGFFFLFQKPGATSDGFGLKQGSPSCTNAGVEGTFAFEATGTWVTGAPVTGPVAFIGELNLRVDSSGKGVITGHLSSSQDGNILIFAQDPVAFGSYSIRDNCRGTANIKLKGQPEMHFSLVVVSGGSELLAIETDPDTVVTGTLVAGN
jgi:hypothetical protein